MPRAETLPSAPTIPAVVIDNGSGVVKAGMAGEEEPSCLLPTAGLTAADNPFERGIVANWDAMEAVWSRAFAQLRVDPEECNMLVTSPLYDTKDNKERLFQTCFETFGAPGVYTSAPAVFELYAAGRENGVVVGCGAQCTYAVLVHEGLPDVRTMVRSDVAGDALTAYTATILKGIAGGSASAIDLATAKRAKEALAACAADESGRPPQGVNDATFELPDGKKIKVDVKSRLSMAEPLFEPTLVGEASGGLAQLVVDAIRLRDRDGMLESTETTTTARRRKEKAAAKAAGLPPFMCSSEGTENCARAVAAALAPSLFVSSLSSLPPCSHARCSSLHHTHSLSGYANVVIGGGSTLIPNLPERLTRDIALKANAACQPAVCAPPERLHSAWVGGSILGSLAVAGTMWVSKAEYDENGPLIVHRKCF